MHFREFQSKDKNAITKLMQALNKEDPEQLPLSSKKIDNLFQAVKSSNQVSLFVAEEQDQIVGYAVFIKAFSVEFFGIYGEIDELYIKPEFRNKGVGTAFIKFIKNLARSQNCQALYMVATPKNKKAQVLYEKLGFKSLPRVAYIKLLVWFKNNPARPSSCCFS